MKTKSWKFIMEFKQKLIRKISKFILNFKEIKIKNRKRKNKKTIFKKKMKVKEHVRKRARI